MRYLMLTLLLGISASAQDLPASALSEIRMPYRLPVDATYRQVAVWQSEEPGGHMTGRVMDYPDAVGGKVWSVVVDRDPADTAVLYGPYATLPAGNYLALFRLRLGKPTDDDYLGRIDASQDAGAGVIIQQPLNVSDLSADHWTQVPLAFHLSGDRLECRLFWSGAADLLMDQITLYEVTGGSMPPSAVRVPQPTYTGQPTNLPYQFTEPADLFPPTPAPAAKLEVLDARTLPVDLRHMLLSLQGLVNRSQPRVYLILDSTDELWLKCLQERGGIREVEMLPNAKALVDRYRGLVKGAVVTDPRVPCSRNVGMMLASTKDALVASARLARDYQLTVLDDLHGRFKDNVEGYRWAFDTLWPELSHQVAAVLWHDNSDGLRDYLYQHRVFTFWLSGPLDGATEGHDAQGEVALMEQILAKMPVNMPILGYPWAGKDVGIGEGAGVTLFAQFAKYLVGSVGATNLSVHSGVKLPPLTQPAYPTPPTDPTKVYMTWVMSDGDNLPVLSRGNFPQLWEQPERGKTPMAWTISPSAYLLMPVIADYYYRTSTPNDAWIGAVSGIGYTYPDEYGKRFGPAGQKQAFDDFLALTAKYDKDLDLKQMWIMGIRDPDLIRRYAAGVPDLTAIFPDYGKVVDNYDDAFYPSARGIPIFHAATTWREEDSREERIARTVNYIRAMTPTTRPAFLHLFIWNWGTDLAQQLEIEKRLGPEYVAVRPEHLAAMARRELDRVGLLVKLPAQATAITGQPLVLDGAVTNASSKQLVAKLTPTGLSEASVEPASITLAPGQREAFVVQGKPTGNSAGAVVTSDYPTITKLANLRALPADELMGPVRGLDRPVAEYPAVSLSHRSGLATPSPGTLADEAWSVQPGRDEPGHVVFGPYAPLDKGNYVALFRVQRQAGPAQAGPLVILDTHVGGGDTTATLSANADELPEGKWVLLPLEFNHPGGTIETRAYWSGGAPLLFDTVLIYRVTTGGGK